MSVLPRTDRLTGHNAAQAYDVERVRADFPVLAREVYGKPLVYLDNAASAQKPRAVIEAMQAVLENEYTNVHRGAHYLSQQLTDRYEAVRESVAAFLNAGSPEEVVITRNATEAINLVASSHGGRHLRAGDEIIVSEMEHHANIVPWQMLCERNGLTLKVARIHDDGALDMAHFESLLGPAVKLVAITHCSNVLGTTVPAAEITRLAHASGALVLFDGSQAAVHMPVDVRAIDADFYVFTGHKLYGPTAVGILYGKADLLAAMPPYQGGGDMIERVSFEGTTYAEPPHRFEAGTPPIVEVIGLGAAVDYVNALGMENIAAHEAALVDYGHRRLGAIDGLRLYGTAEGKAAIFSFAVDGLHPYDTAAALDREGVAVRVGQHCAEPLMARLGVDGTVRASCGLYTSLQDIDRLAEAIVKAKSLFGVA